MDSLSNYSPKDEREAQSICERITPRLAHANAAVVLSAVKVRSINCNEKYSFDEFFLVLGSDEDDGNFGRRYGVLWYS